MSPVPPPTDEGLPMLALQDAVATVRLRRPSQRNSLRDEDLRALLSHFTQIERESPR